VVEGRTWLDGEPTIDEVMADPIVHLMMRSDGVAPEDVWGDRSHCLGISAGTTPANKQSRLTAGYCSGPAVASYHSRTPLTSNRLPNSRSCWPVTSAALRK